MTEKLPGLNSCKEIRDNNFKDNNKCDTTVKWPYLLYTFTDAVAVHSIIMGGSLGLFSINGNIYVGDTLPNPMPNPSGLTKCAGPVTKDGIYKCGTILTGKYVLFTPAAAFNTEIFIEFSEFRVYSWLDTTPTIVLPATNANVANSLTSPSQSNVGLQFREDDAFAIVMGNDTPLFGMMASVKQKGWGSFTSGTNEAYILFNLGKRMHVKVVTVIGKEVGGSTYKKTTASHFIGLYDQDSFPPSTPPKSYLAGSGGHDMYSKGWDHPIKAWGKYVALWNSYAENYIVVSYIAIFATDTDCNDTTNWLVTTTADPAVIIPNQAETYTVDIFPNIPPACKAYIKSTTINAASKPSWIKSFVYPNLSANPHPTFEETTLTFTMDFYLDGFITSPKTFSLKVINNGQKLFISQMPDVTYLLGSNNPIVFFKWNDDVYDITVTTDSPDYILVEPLSEAPKFKWNVKFQQVASKLITYTAKSTSSPQVTASLKFTLNIVCGTKMTCLDGFYSDPYSHLVNAPAVTSTCRLIGTQCAGQNILPSVTCTPSMIGQLGMTDPLMSIEGAQIYSLKLRTVANNLNTRLYTCTVTYTDNAVLQSGWTEQIDIRVYCQPTGLIFTEIDDLSIRYRLQNQIVQQGPLYSVSEQTTASGYVKILPSVTHNPTICDPPYDIQYQTSISPGTSGTIQQYQGTFASAIISVDNESGELKLNKITDEALAGVYQVTISAKAKNSSLTNATEIVTAASYSFKLRICNQKIVLGPTMTTITKEYTITYPGAVVKLFDADYAFEGIACNEDPPFAAITHSPSDFLGLTVNSSSYNVQMVPSSYQELPGKKSFTLTATNTADPLVTNSEFTFEVELKCQAVFEPSMSILDQTFDQNVSKTQSLLVDFPTQTLGPIYCQPSFQSYIIEEENGNTLDFITIDVTTRKLIVTPTSSTVVRSYVVKISAIVSMPNLDAALAAYQQTVEACRFNLNILSVATITLTPSSQPTLVTYTIDGSNTSKTVDLPQYSITPTWFVQNAYTLSATMEDGSSLKSFATLTSREPSAQLQIRTLTYSQKGEYRIKITATSTVDPLKNNSEVIITVKLLCKLTSITPLSVATIEHFLNPVGDYQRTMVPISFTIEPSECKATYTVEMEPSNQIFSYYAETQNLVIDTKDASNVGLHFVSLNVNTAGSSLAEILTSVFKVPVNVICRVESLVALSTIPDQDHNVQKQPYSPTTFNIPAFTQTPACQSQLDYTLRQKIDGIFTTPNLPFTLSGNTYVLNTLNPSLKGIYIMEIKVGIKPSGRLNEVLPTPVKLTFNASISDTLFCTSFELKYALPLPALYLVESQEMVLPFPEYTFTPKACVQDVSYELKLINKITNMSYQLNPSFNTTIAYGTMPSLLKSWDSSGFRIQTNNLLDCWSIYSFQLITKEAKSQLENNKYVFSVETAIDCATNDFIMPAIKKTLTYSIGQPAQVITFDDVKDTVSQKTGIVMMCGPIKTQLLFRNEKDEEVSQLPTPIKFNALKREITVETSIEQDIGIYRLVLAFQFKNYQDKRKSESIELTIEPKLIVKTQEAAAQKATDPPAEVTAQPAKADPVNAETKTDYPQSQSVDKQAQKTDMQDLFQNTLTQRPTVPKGFKLKMRFAKVNISDVSSNGLITLKMDEQVQLVNQGKFINTDMLQLAYVKNSDEPISMTGFEMLKYEQTMIQIKVSFNEPLLVSAGFQNDMIRVNLSKFLFVPVFEPYELVNEQRILQTDMLMFVLEDELPRQMKSESDFKKVEALSQTINKSMTATVAIPMIAQLVAKSAMKRLWAYFNTMQIVVEFNRFNQVQAPANVAILQKGYNDILQVKVIPDSILQPTLLKFGIDISANDNSTQSIDLPESKRRMLFFSNVQPKNMFRNWAILVGMAVLICALLGYTCYKRKAIWAKLSRQTRKKILVLKNEILWSVPIRTALEIYFPQFMINLLLLKDKKTQGAGFVSPIIQLVLLTSFTVFTFIFIHRNQEKIPDPEFRPKYAAYWTNVEMYKNTRASYYPFVFLLRRTLLALIIFGLSFNCVMQVLLTVQICLLMITWLIIVKPLDSGLKNAIEISNELLLLFHSYFSFVFTMYVPDPLVKYRFGFIYMSVLGIGLTFNISIQVQNIISEFRRLRRLRAARMQIKVEENQSKLPNQDEKELEKPPMRLQIVEEQVEIRQRYEELIRDPNNKKKKKALRDALSKEVNKIIDNLPSVKKQKHDQIIAKVKADLEKLDLERYKEKQAKIIQKVSEDLQKLDQEREARDALNQPRMVSNYMLDKTNVNWGKNQNTMKERKIKLQRDSFFSQMVYEVYDDKSSRSDNSELEIYRPSQNLLNRGNQTRFGDQLSDLESPHFNNFGQMEDDDQPKVVNDKRSQQPQLLEPSQEQSFDSMLQPTMMHNRNYSQQSIHTQMISDSEIKIYKPSQMLIPRPQRIMNSDSEDSDEQPDQQGAKAPKKQRYTPKPIVEFNYGRNFNQPYSLSNIVSPQQKMQRN